MFARDKVSKSLQRENFLTYSTFYFWSSVTSGDPDEIQLIWNRYLVIDLDLDFFSSVMALVEDMVKQADLLSCREDKRDEYLKQEFQLLAERQERKEKEDAERQQKREDADAERAAKLELEKIKLDTETKMLRA